MILLLLLLLGGSAWAADDQAPLRIRCYRGNFTTDDLKNCFPDPPPQFDQHVIDYVDDRYTEAVWRGTPHWPYYGEEPRPGVCSQAIMNYIRSLPSVAEYRRQRGNGEIWQMQLLCQDYVWPWGQGEFGP